MGSSAHPRPRAVDLAFQISWYLIRNQDAAAEQLQVAAEGEGIDRSEIFAAKRIVAVWRLETRDEASLQSKVLQYFYDDSAARGYLPKDVTSPDLEYMRNLESQHYRR
ncbi:hypothetical protein [Rhodococcus sp. IEGM1428]|uniref:hypothetical protein n=1 Tax=Rhodococcus sp. IEGM1428 TaxID=3392191 RepID=UPI003D106E0C